MNMRLQQKIEAHRRRTLERMSGHLTNMIARVPILYDRQLSNDTAKRQFIDPESEFAKDWRRRRTRERLKINTSSGRNVFDYNGPPNSSIATF